MYLRILFLYFILIIIELISGKENEYGWIHSMGNPSNTRRIIPSIPTNFTGKSWTMSFNSSSQDKTIQGTAAGLNGDLYFFVRENSSHLVDNLICLTINGLIRWKISLPSNDNMINIGVSNIIAPHNSFIYFTSSWTNGINSLGKICQISNGQTNNPNITCVENEQLFSPFKQSPLSINDYFIHLYTTVLNQSLAVINTSNLEIIWIDHQIIGCSSESIYNSDGTGIYWIGNDNHFKNVNGKDTHLFDVEINPGGNHFYSFDRYQAIIIQVWQNFNNKSIAISAWDALASSYFHVIWQWNEPYGISKQSTQPIIDEQSTITYISILPYTYAINSTGSTLWKTEIVSQTEINRFNLIANCLTLNSDTNIIYVLVSSLFNDQIKPFVSIFIVPINSTNGQLFDRIYFDVSINTQINAYCPILIGNETLYMSWTKGKYPDLVSLNIMTIEQIK
ncbi:hypothetical protein I4U23_017314 [Adineta vaga]|nr:hypothetical protein I4U23_017314 [Adineta vaga]